MAYLVTCKECGRKRRIDIGEPPYEYDGPAMFECANIECLTVFDALGTTWIVRCHPSELMTTRASLAAQWWQDLALGDIVITSISDGAGKVFRL